MGHLNEEKTMTAVETSYQAAVSEARKNGGACFATAKVTGAAPTGDNKSDER